MNPSFMYHIFPKKEKWFFFARSLRSLAKIEITPLLIITSLTWNNEPKFYVPYFPYKREEIFFARSLAKIEITPLLIITSLTWNNEPKFYVPSFPYKKRSDFLSLASSWNYVPTNNPPPPPHSVLFRVRICSFPLFESTPYLRTANISKPPFRGLFAGFSYLGDPPKSWKMLNVTPPLNSE